MGKLFAKRKKDEVSSSSSSSSSDSDNSKLITTSDEDEISKLKSSSTPTNIEIIFDLRNSKRLIKCLQEINTLKGQDHYSEMLKDKLILIILSNVKEVMGMDFDEDLLDKFFSFLNRRLMFRMNNDVSQFYITKNEESTSDVDPTDFLFFECLEDISHNKKWSQHGLEGVMNEPVQCIFINNKGERSFDFESAFIMMYAKEQPCGEKFKFKFLLCKIENEIWSFPGGKKMSPSESSAKCITREISEELYGISIGSIESSIELGPLFSFGGSAVFAHEVEWGKTGEIINNLIKNYSSLKKENQLFDFDSEKISKSITLDEEYLDYLLELLNKFKFVEEIVDYAFVSSDDIEKMKGGRSFFLKQLVNLFHKNIMKRIMSRSNRSRKFNNK